MGYIHDFDQAVKYSNKKKIEKMKYEKIRPTNNLKYKPCDCCKTNQIRAFENAKYCKNCARFINTERTRQYNQIRATMFKDYKKYLQKAQDWAKRLRACHLQQYCDLDHKDCLEIAEIFEGDLKWEHMG